MKLLRLLFIMFVVFGLVGSAYAARTHQKQTTKMVTAQPSVAQPVDINTANAESLATLRGVGVKKAQAIVAYRNKNGAFKSLHDLTAVKGISAKFLAKLQKNNPSMIVAKSVV